MKYRKQVNLASTFAIAVAWFLFCSTTHARGRHAPTIVCDSLFLRVRAYPLSFKITPKLKEQIKKLTMDHEKPSQGKIPLTQEVFLEKVIWIFDNFNFAGFKPNSFGKLRIRKQSPTEAQAFQLAYASLARGFDIEMLQQRMATYRFELNQTPGSRPEINTMDDFIKQFSIDNKVGRKIEPDELKDLYTEEQS